MMTTAIWVSSIPLTFFSSCNLWLTYQFNGGISLEVPLWSAFSILDIVENSNMSQFNSSASLLNCDYAIIELIILSLYGGSAAQIKKEKERKERKKKRKRKGGGDSSLVVIVETTAIWITAVWRPLAQMCRWSWPQWLPGAGHSSLWWFSAGMRNAGTGFCSVAARTAGCVFVVDEGVVAGACS